jgi:hypothetical protein
MADALRRLASENGLVGSRHDLSQWVEETFKEELERRRQAIREVVRKRTGTPDLSDYSQVTVLPSLPSAISGTEEGSTKSGALPRTVAPPAQLTPGEGKGSVSSPPPLELLDALEARELDDGPSRTKRFAIGGAAAVGVALLVFLLATRGGSDPQPPEKSGTSTAAKAVIPEPVAAPSAPEAAPAPSAPRERKADTDESAGEGREKSSGKKTRAAAVWRAPAPPPAEPRAAFPEPKAPPAAKAPPPPPVAATPVAPKPAAPPPAKAGGDDFESNPYLRR